MDFLNHQSTGVNGLRIAASICVVLGWLCVLSGFISALALADVVIIIYPFLSGLIGCGIMYLTACFIRAIATIAEAAQLYYYNNTEHEEYEEQEEQDNV